jgi:hypothetical protein
MGAVVPFFSGFPELKMRFPVGVVLGLGGIPTMRLVPFVVVIVYISVAAVTAAIGCALTAPHF